MNSKIYVTGSECKCKERKILGMRFKRIAIVLLFAYLLANDSWMYKMKSNAYCIPRNISK